MADKALYVVGQKRFVQTMRKAGADMKELKEVNRRATRQDRQTRRINPRRRHAEGRYHPRRPQDSVVCGPDQLRLARTAHQT